VGLAVPRFVRSTSFNIVFKWTVMRAFTPGASITEETRAKVLRAAKKLNYSPNLLARSLATNLTNQVAVFIDDFGNPRKLPFLEKLTESLQAEGLAVMLININRNFDHVHALLNAGQQQVDAIVLFGTSFRNETLRDKRRGPGFPPLIVLARDSQIRGVPAVTCDTSIAMDEICALSGNKALPPSGLHARAADALHGSWAGTTSNGIVKLAAGWVA
jgi:LacI family transcriptional regulator